MGAGASFFKKKNNAVKVPEEVKPDAAAPEKAPDFDGDNEAAQVSGSAWPRFGFERSLWRRLCSRHCCIWCTLSQYHTDNIGGMYL